MKAIRISEEYWNSLSENEQTFIRTYAIEHGVKYCKRIITLANNFEGWDCIANLSEYMKTKTEKILSQNVWVVIKGNSILGLVEKTENIGISERIKAKTDKGYVEVWNNWNTKNPSKSDMKSKVLYVMNF